MYLHRYLPNPQTNRETKTQVGKAIFIRMSAVLIMTRNK